MRALLTAVLALCLFTGLAACKTTVDDPSDAFNRLNFLERNAP